MSEKRKCVFANNPSQNIVDKLSKSSKTGFSMERFRADILQFSSATVEIFILARQMDTTFISSIQWFY